MVTVDRLDLQDLQDTPAVLVQWLDTLAVLVSLDQLVMLGPVVQLVLLGQLDSVVPKAIWAMRAVKESLALQDSQDSQVVLVLDSLDQVDLLAALGSLDQLALLAVLDSLDQVDL